MNLIFHLLIKKQVQDRDIEFQEDQKDPME